MKPYESTFFASTRKPSAGLSFQISIFFGKKMPVFAVSFLLLMMPSLNNHISKILFSGSKEKMIWIYANRIVAFVANKILAQIVSDKKNICSSVGGNYFSVEKESSIFPAQRFTVPLMATGVCYA